MKPPRGLSPAEAAAWAKLAATVTPLNPPRSGKGDRRTQPSDGEAPAAIPDAAKPVLPVAASKGVSPRGGTNPRVPLHHAARGSPPPVGEEGRGLDSHWERRLARAGVEPEVTLDLHGHTLEQAHRRLDSGLAQALAMGARVVLVITGKPRPVDAADRAHRRGAIRAKILDWLAAGPHAADIAAVRAAHRRHGGDGAIYLVLRRRRS